MWTLLLLLYRLLSWPVSIASQAAMVVGALRLFFSPPMVALATAGVGVAIVAAALALYIAVGTLGQAIEDRRDDAEAGIL